MISTLKDRLRRVWQIGLREARIFRHRPLLIFCMLIAPISATIFFSTLMYEGLPQQIPTGLVDCDDSQTTRTIVRIISAMKTTGLQKRYSNFTEARQAVQRGEIYAFFYIPEGTTEKAIAGRQPKISFYTNDAYFVAGALLMKDLKTISELAGMAVTRETLTAKGATNDQAMAILQPLNIEAHPYNNPYLNYGVLLNNLILPGILILLIMLSTAYAIGMEWKMGSQSILLDMAGGSVPVALSGKLLPQTLLYTVVFVFIDVYFYRLMQYPCQCGLLPMMALGLLTVLAAQACGLFMFGLFIGQMRMSMSGCALWGVLSIPIAGFSFPTTAMLPVWQKLSWIFPLRDYFLIYANQALDGYSIVYAWKPLTAMLVFLGLPFLVIGRYKKSFLTTAYKP